MGFAGAAGITVPPKPRKNPNVYRGVSVKEAADAFHRTFRALKEFEAALFENMPKKERTRG